MPADTPAHASFDQSLPPYDGSSSNTIVPSAVWMCRPTYCSGSASIASTVPMSASVLTEGTGMVALSQSPSTTITPSPVRTTESSTAVHEAYCVVGSSGGQTTAGMPSWWTITASWCTGWLTSATT